MLIAVTAHLAHSLQRNSKWYIELNHYNPPVGVSFVVMLSHFIAHLEFLVGELVRDVLAVDHLAIVLLGL